MKEIGTYIFILLFTFAFSYKTVKYVIDAKADMCYSSEMDCENEKEKEDSIEKDEIIDPFCSEFFHGKKMLLKEENFLRSELIINFSSSNYSNPVYSPPEFNA